MENNKTTQSTTLNSVTSTTTIPSSTTTTSSSASNNFSSIGESSTPQSAILSNTVNLTADSRPESYVEEITKAYESGDYKLAFKIFGLAIHNNVSAVSYPGVVRDILFSGMEAFLKLTNTLKQSKLSSENDKVKMYETLFFSTIKQGIKDGKITGSGLTAMMHRAYKSNEHKLVLELYSLAKKNIVDHSFILEFPVFSSLQLIKNIPNSKDYYEHQLLEFIASEAESKWFEIHGFDYTIDTACESKDHELVLGVFDLSVKTGFVNGYLLGSITNTLCKLINEVADEKLKVHYTNRLLGAVESAMKASKTNENNPIDAMTFYCMMNTSDYYKNHNVTLGLFDIAKKYGYINIGVCDHALEAASTLKEGHVKDLKIKEIEKCKAVYLGKDEQEQGRGQGL